MIAKRIPLFTVNAKRFPVNKLEKHLLITARKLVNLRYIMFFDEDSVVRIAKTLDQLHDCLLRESILFCRDNSRSKVDSVRFVLDLYDGSDPDAFSHIALHSGLVNGDPRALFVVYLTADLNRCGNSISPQ